MRTEIKPYGKGLWRELCGLNLPSGVAVLGRVRIICPSSPGTVNSQTPMEKHTLPQTESFLRWWNLMAAFNQRTIHALKRCRTQWHTPPTSEMTRTLQSFKHLDRLSNLTASCLRRFIYSWEHCFHCLHCKAPLSRSVEVPAAIKTDSSTTSNEMNGSKSMGKGGERINQEPELSKYSRGHISARRAPRRVGLAFKEGMALLLFPFNSFLLFFLLLKE